MIGFKKLSSFLAEDRQIIAENLSEIAQHLLNLPQGLVDHPKDVEEIIGPTLEYGLRALDQTTEMLSGTRKIIHVSKEYTDEEYKE